MFVRLHLFTALSLLSCSALPATQALNMNNICALVSDGSLLASHNSFTNYYMCQNGVATLQNCSDDKYFDKDWQKCLGNDQNPCDGHKVGSWVGQPGSCTGFYYCSSKGAELLQCPSGQNFDEDAQMCKYAREYPCGNDDSNTTGDINICLFVQNDVYFGSASRCNAWNLCTENELTTGDCDHEFSFNVAYSMCDCQANTNCTQVTNDPELISSNGGPCSISGARRPSPDCGSYYECDGVVDKLVDCENATDFYDTVLETCVNRMDARNNCDRCAGTMANYVNEYSMTDCSGYLYCQNGVMQSTGFCPEDTYFNEIEGSCFYGDQPKFGCCNPDIYQNSFIIVLM